MRKSGSQEIKIGVRSYMHTYEYGSLMKHQVQNTEEAGYTNKEDLIDAIKTILEGMYEEKTKTKDKPQNVYYQHYN